MEILVLDRDHALDDERARKLGRDHPGDEMDTLEHERPVLCRRTLERGLDADDDVPRLVEEAENRGIARLLLLGARQGKARFEARVVNRRHELLGEEGPHRLADEVRRRDARDAEPVRGLGRDRRLARAGRTSDEQEQGLLELLQRAQPLETTDRRRRVLVADHVCGQFGEPVEVEGRDPTLGEVAIGAMGDEIRPFRIESSDYQRTRHEPLRERNLVPEGQWHARGVVRSYLYS